ncbi:MAG TPA: NAD(P)-binding protein [Solirubrobacteraceae bacterium]|nr:NAD(P)-binding protein [Solirubrobacteraceae bacterium]
MLGEATGLAEAILLRLARRGIPAEYAGSGPDADIAAALQRDRWRAVVVTTRDDVLALRLSLLSAHIRPDLPIWTTMFDATVTRELHHAVPAVNVVSPTALVAGELGRACVAAGAKPVPRLRHGLRLVDDALRLLVGAGAGLLLALLLQAAALIAALHQNVLDALYFSTRTVATVADFPGAPASPVWFKAVSTALTIAAVLLLAIFTAALVRRLSRPRLTALFGPRAAPSRGHVLLVGFGQVGFRLAQELRRHGIPVLAVERDLDAPCLRLARAAGIPVAIGRGDDRAMLELLGIRRCSVVAAVTSSDLVNVEVGLTAADLSPGIPLVLRLGDGQVAAETDSLLHLGRVCDAHALAADTLVQAITGDGDGTVMPAPAPADAPAVGPGER